jgi:hypothetical protein
MMLLKKALATIVVEYGWPSGMKCAYFNRWSMTVSMRGLRHPIALVF